MRAAAIGRLDLRHLGRTLLHAAIVGAFAGVVGSLFYRALELAQHFILEDLAGYVPLRAGGEGLSAHAPGGAFRWYLLILIPAVGALAGGALTSLFAPEAKGGGADATIHAFHHKGGVIRGRVVWVKALASVFTLGSGGSGGREGPTMQIGGAIGSLVGGALRVSPRERRLLLMSGLAAGMAAVFRTPLGAALLAAEVLYRDDFESDGLIPALLASVISYSVFISLQGESTLFHHADKYWFVPAHLPFYAVMAVLLSVFASGFVSLLTAVQRVTTRLPIPAFARPGLGGLLLGVFVTPVILYVGFRVGQPGQGIGILGGGYGAAQIAITSASWLPTGWRGAELLLLVAVVKIVATSLTVGTGGSAGDFGPSLVIGGLLGGAFGRAAQMLLHDPRIDPGAFALVGMGTFYGGIAHVPISSMVMTCELAGSYDLLVPLMLAEGIAFVALRRRSLYHAQPATKRDSPAHRQELVLHALEDVRVATVCVRERPYVSFTPSTKGSEVVRKIADASWQDTFPVLDEKGAMVGLVNADVARTLAADDEFERFTVAADLMLPPTSVTLEDKLHRAIELMLETELRELPVVDAEGKVVGFVDEAEITRAYLGSTVAHE
jgi:chloride channel protein, CIC family